jgi:hypothetical protein
LALMAGSAAHADYYVCTNAKGAKVYGDKPPSTCVGDIEEHNPDGTLKATIPAPETPEQRRKREEEQRRRRDEQERACAQRDREKALLETYASESEIEAARKRALAGKQSSIGRAQDKIKVLDREKKKLDDEAEFYVKREMPDKLKRAFENNAVLRDQQEHAIADAEQEKARINTAYDADVKLFRSLQANGPTLCVRTASGLTSPASPAGSR